MDELNIGGKLQAARAERGITIRELSELSGVTSSMLSQIERGLANPSIKTLKDIAEALKMPLYLFFKTEENEEFIVRHDNRRTIGRQDEQDMSYSLLTPGMIGTIEFCLMEIPAGSDHASKAQSHIGEEVAYVLSGPVDIVMDQNTYTLETGDSLRIAPHSVHRWLNHEGQPAQIIFAITPPSF